jgi:hypothetical protein
LFGARFSVIVPSPVDWLGIHTENYLGEGGYDLHVLE